MYRAAPAQPTEVSGHKLGKISGVDPRRISEKLKKGELKRNKNGLYDLEESMKALGIPIETMEILKDSSGPININEMRAIKERETAYLKRLERGLAEGSLVEIDEVLKKLTPLFTGTKVRMLALPAKLAPVMANESNSSVCKAIIEGEVRVILAELASGIERELDLGTGEIDGAASASDNKRLGAKRKSAKSGSKRGAGKVEKRKKSGTD
jgi:hypothetical protein